MSDRLAVMDGAGSSSSGTPQRGLPGAAQRVRRGLPRRRQPAWTSSASRAAGATRAGAVRGVHPGGAGARRPRDGPGRAVIRPECVELEEAGLTGDNRLPGMVERVVFLGSTTQVNVRLPHGADGPVAGHQRRSPRKLSSRPGASIGAPAAARRSRVLRRPPGSDDAEPVAVEARHGRAATSAEVGEVLQRRACRCRAAEPRARRTRAAAPRTMPTSSSVASALSAGVGDALHGAVEPDRHGDVGRVAEEELADHEVVERRGEDDHGRGEDRRHQQRAAGRCGSPATGWRPRSWAASS